MSQQKIIDCLACGMSVSFGVVNCPKCDNRLDLQHDGSTVTIDIAHNRETVRDALLKLQRNMKAARETNAQNLRVIVGSGRIREEILGLLYDLRSRETIIDFNQDENPGAVTIKLKP